MIRCGNHNSNDGSNYHLTVSDVRECHQRYASPAEADYALELEAEQAAAEHAAESAYMDRFPEEEYYAQQEADRYENAFFG